MKWNDLSDEAKGIIEWVENPLTHKRETISIKIGQCFNPHREVNIMVTKEIYQEVLRFVTEDEEIMCNQYTDGLIFKLKDESKIVLH